MVIYFAALSLLVTSGLCVSTEKHFVGGMYLLTISFCSHYYSVYVFSMYSLSILTCYVPAGFLILKMSLFHKVLSLLIVPTCMVQIPICPFCAECANLQSIDLLQMLYRFFLFQEVYRRGGNTEQHQKTTLKRSFQSDFSFDERHHFPPLYFLSPLCPCLNKLDFT